MLSCSTWAITKAVINTLGLPYGGTMHFELDQKGLLSNVLFVAFSICSKMHREHRSLCITKLAFNVWKIYIAKWHLK
jgi:hypothetical protein